MNTLLRTLALAASLFSATQTLAQTIPNGGFETWTQRGLVEIPQSWLTTDDVLSAQLGGNPLPLSTNTVIKSTDKRTGNFAARLQTQNFLGQVVVPGLLVLGPRLNLDSDFPGGVPFTARPARFQMYYKLTGLAAAADSAYVQVALTRTVNGTAQPVAGAEQVLTPQTGYTLLDLPLTYVSGGFPDSLRLVVASGVAENITAGTLLTVDDLAFTGTVASTQDAALAAALNIFPNPSTNGVFTVAASGRETDLTNATLTVRNMLGSVVLRQPAGRAGRARTLDLQAQPAGIYTLRLDTPSGFVVQKLVKQ